MADSFQERIAAIERQYGLAVRERDKHYPGSPEWESEHAKVDEWESALRELRRQMRNG